VEWHKNFERLAMKKNLVPFSKKNPFSISLLLLFFLQLQIVHAQDKRDTTSGLKKTLKANLSDVDPTAPAVYKVNIKKTILISAAATVANAIAVPTIIHSKLDLTPEELAGATQRRALNFFDKWVLNQDPNKRDMYYTLSDHTLTGIIAASAATFLFNKRSKKDWLRLSLMFYKTQFLTFAFYDFSPIGPTFQNKLRPVVYYSHFPEALRRQGRQRNSLYSGHAAQAASAAFFAAKVYCDYHPEIGRKKYLVYSIAAVPALFGGWLRVKALAHYPSDVLIGTVIGAAFGILVPESHRIKNQNVQLGTFFNGQSGGLQLTYKLGGKAKSVRS
jgi:hypothetical protein